jgi:UDP-glucuronate decarboxylase
LLAFSIHTGRECIPTTDALSPISSCKRSSDITIYGNGGQTRSFCFVSDLIDGLVKLMGTPQAVTGPVNIGNPAEFTILEFANLTIELTNLRSQIVRRPLPQDDPKQRQPDLTGSAALSAQMQAWVANQWTT